MHCTVDKKKNMSKPNDPLISEEDLTGNQQVEEEDEEIEEYVNYMIYMYSFSFMNFCGSVKIFSLADRFLWTLCFSIISKIYMLII